MDASIAPSLFVGALVDKEVRRLDIEGGQVVAELGRRIRDVRVHDGYVRR